MSDGLSLEVRAVQNPALGAMLIWRCCVGFSSSHDRGEAAPLPLLFLVLPVLFHKETSELLISTHKSSGLRKFVEKFQLAAQNKTDLLLAIAPRAKELRTLTAHSLGVAVLGNLITVDPVTGRVIAISQTPATAGIPATIRPLLGGSEKLGAWFARLSMYETALLLNVTL